MTDHLKHAYDPGTDGIICAATLDDAAADPALTLDIARELLREAAEAIRCLTPEQPAKDEGRAITALKVTLFGVELLKPTVKNYGLYAEHNMPCCVFTDRPAVFDCNTGIFHPSRQAQAKGWRLVRADSWFQHFLLRHFFGDPQ